MRSDRANTFPWWLLGIAIGCAVPSFVMWWATGSGFALVALALFVVLFAVMMVQVVRARRKRKSEGCSHPESGLDFVLDTVAALIHAP